MCQDEKIARRIREQLRIDLLVSGTYQIEGGQIEIVAQVIEIGSRKELCRRSVKAPTSEVLELPQKLSAELLAWLRGQTAEQTLPAMASWTRSIPAAQALYEGMHLFDQGLYSQAWLKFRQASRSDPAYPDALYWMARMYYFMNQYEHARLAYDKFVYLDATHPRLGDAVKEYLHTLEKTDVPGERLLAIYADLIRRYPDVLVYNEMDMTAGVSNKRFLEDRSGQLLGQMGRPAEGARLVAENRERLNMWESRVAMNNAMTHNMLTGEVVMPDALARQYEVGMPDALAQQHEHALQFTPDNLEVTVKGSGQSQYVWFYALAPSGYTFKSLRLMPEIQGGEKMTLGVAMHKDSYADVPQSDRPIDFPSAAAHGFLFNQMPRTGIVRFHYYYNGHESGWSINGLRVKAELEKVPEPHGAIWVDCNNTQDFNVYVDGRYGRSGCGLIGLLAPGPHELEFHLGRKAIAAEEIKESPLAPTKARCEVVAGKVVKLTATMSWKEDSLWRAWHAGAFADRSYPGYDTDLNYKWGRPSIQLDDQAIRIVWSRMGDLWWTESRDGKTFTSPQRLPMPVSTSWSEERPTLLRDESGRFILAFISDRNGQRTKRLYVCWSRDMLHWSNPAMVEDRVVSIYDLAGQSRAFPLCRRHPKGDRDREQLGPCPLGADGCSAAGGLGPRGQAPAAQ